MNKKILIAIVAASIVFIALFAYIFLNKDSIVSGKILEITGLVEVKKKNSKEPVKVFENMAFTEGDVLYTREDGRAHLEIDESKDVEVASNTELAFTELKSSIKAAQGKTHLELQKGKVKIKISEKLKGDSKFQIETPNAIMGVMGTEFYVYHDENGTWVGVIEGQVEVTKPNGEKVVLVPRGKAVLIKPDGQVEEMELTSEKEAEFYENATRFETPDDTTDFVLEENENNNPEPTPPEDPLPNELIAIGDEEQGPVTIVDPEPEPQVTPELDPVPLPEPIPEPVPLPEPIPEETPQQPDDELKQAKDQLYQVLNTAKTFLTDNRIPTSKKQQLQQLINTVTQVYETGTVAQIREAQASLTNFLVQLNEDFEKLAQAKVALYADMENANQYVQKDELSNVQKDQLNELLTEATNIYSTSTDISEIDNIRKRINDHLSYLDQLIQVKAQLREKMVIAQSFKESNELSTVQKGQLEQLITEANDRFSNAIDINAIQDIHDRLQVHLSNLDQLLQTKLELKEEVEKAQSYLQKAELIEQQKGQLAELIEDANNQLNSATEKAQMEEMLKTLSEHLAVLDEFIQAKKDFNALIVKATNYLEDENAPIDIIELFELQELKDNAKVVYDTALSTAEFETKKAPLQLVLTKIDLYFERRKAYDYYRSGLFESAIMEDLEKSINNADQIIYQSEDLQEVQDTLNDLSKYLSDLNYSYDFVLEFIQVKEELFDQIINTQILIYEFDLSNEQIAEIEDFIGEADEVYYNSKDLDEIKAMTESLFNFTLSVLKNVLNNEIESAEKVIQSKLISDSELAELLVLVDDAKQIYNNSTNFEVISNAISDLRDFLSSLTDYEYIKSLLELAELIEKAENYSRKIYDMDYERLFSLLQNVDSKIEDAKDIYHNVTDLNEIQNMNDSLIEYFSDLEELLSLYYELLKAEAVIINGIVNNEEQLKALEDLMSEGWDTFTFEFIFEAVSKAQLLRQDLLESFENLGVTEQDFEFLMTKYELARLINTVNLYKSDTGEWYWFLQELTEQLDSLLVEATTILGTSTIEQKEEIREISNKLNLKFELASVITNAVDILEYSYDELTIAQREELEQLINDAKTIYQSTNLDLHQEMIDKWNNFLTNIDNRFGP